MKKYLKILAILLVFVLSATVFAACGESGDDTGDSGETVKGETKTGGNITIFVPEGFTFENKDGFGDESANDAKLTNDSSVFDYFMLKVNWSEESVNSSIETSRSLNDGAEDVEITAGDVTWKGIAYNSLGYDMVIVYAPMGSGYSYFTACSHTKDDATLKAILESIKVTAE